MPFLNDRVLDNGLTILTTESETLHLCSSEPASYAAVAGVSLATKATPATTGPADGTGGGRAVTFSAITDGVVNTAGTATHIAVVDNTNSRLLFTQALAASKAITTGSPFTTDVFEVRIPDAA